LLTTEGSPIKHSREILKLLKAALLPKQIAVIHCPGHQVAKGNQKADMAAKEATRRPYVQAPV
jgi:ribonuclease HI